MSTSAPAAAAQTLHWSGWSDCGKVRANNEDAFLGLQFDAREIFRLGKFGQASARQSDFAFAVSDGMGGAQGGEFASQIATEKLTLLMPRAFKQSASGLEIGAADILTELFDQIHKALLYVGACYEECQGMGATLSLCWFRPGWMHFGHIGDSRIYYLPARADAIKQLSEDDTHVGWLYRQGKINEREARTHPRRTVLQRALGAGNQFVEPQVGAVGYEPGDLFLLCSDGLVDGLYDHHLVELLRAPAPAHGNLARRLVEESVRSQGRDNTTAMVIQAL
jgi:protein phosphatase